MKILSPVVCGSGVEVVHGALAGEIAGYQLQRVDPRLGILAPLIRPGTGDWDVVHTLPELGGFANVPAARVVVTFHNFYLDAFAIRHASLSQRFFYSMMLARYVVRAVRRADVVTAVSAFTAGLVRSHFGVGALVIRNGVDAERFRPPDERPTDGRLRVVFAGNLSRRKGKGVVEQLAAELQDACEFICASGLRREAEPRIVGGIHYLGRVAQQDMPAIYQAADVLLLPTLREGMSLATLEAMACGLPVVTTNLSSQPELIDHGRGGYTLDHRDVAGFARCLRNLAVEPALRRDMGDYNRAKVVEGYTLERMVGGYRQVFEAVVQ